MDQKTVENLIKLSCDARSNAYAKYSNFRVGAALLCDDGTIYQGTFFTWSGHKYLDVYFKKCHDLLKKNGILALQVITSPDSRYDSLRKGVDWIQKHIFPGSLLPSVAAINGAINRTGDLTMVDLKDMGLHYAQTLKLWLDQFNSNLPAIRALGFDDTFVRKWNYYFCYCEAAFAMRNINVMQLVYARPNNTLR